MLMSSEYNTCVFLGIYIAVFLSDNFYLLCESLRRTYKVVDSYIKGVHNKYSGNHL